MLVYEKQVASGESYRFGKWVVVLGFEDARSARNRTRAADEKAVLRLSCGHPQHGSVVRGSAEGRPFRTRQQLDCRMPERRHCRLLQRDRNRCRQLEWARRGGMVGIPTFDRRRPDLGRPALSSTIPSGCGRGARCARPWCTHSSPSPNGTLIATVIRYANERWEKQRAPVYFLSDDHGHTWKGPHEFDESATVDDIAYTMNTSFVHDGEVFIVFRGGTSNMTPGGPQTLWVSDDNGNHSANGACCPSTTPATTGPPARSMTAESSSTPTTLITRETIKRPNRTSPT